MLHPHGFHPGPVCLSLSYCEDAPVSSCVIGNHLLLIALCGERADLAEGLRINRCSSSLLQHRSLQPYISGRRCKLESLTWRGADRSVEHSQCFSLIISLGIEVWYRGGFGCLRKEKAIWEHLLYFGSHGETIFATHFAPIMHFQLKQDFVKKKLDFIHEELIAWWKVFLCEK